LTHAVAAIAARATGESDVPSRLIQTLCWILRGLMTDRLRSTPRSAVDIDLLVGFLMAGLQAASTHSLDSRAPDAERAIEAEQV
jgi:hypothetical protein